MHQENFVLIVVGDLNKPTMNAIRYARLLTGEAIAIHVQINLSDSVKIEDKWKLHDIDIPLLILESPNVSVLQPLKEFVNPENAFTLK